MRAYTQGYVRMRAASLDYYTFVTALNPVATRRWHGKGVDFNNLTDDYIHSVQLKINRIPREKLNFSTP